MKLIRQLRCSSIVLVCLFITSSVIAQTGECPALVAQAVQYISDTCQGVARNQACYGNLEIQATPINETIDLQFSEPGDIADLFGIASLRLSSLAEPDEWGIALLRIQANLPNTLPGQNVTMLLFGDVTLENQGGSLVTIAGTTRQAINVRRGPGNNHRVQTYGRRGDSVRIDGRNEPGTWYRIVLDDGSTGWVDAELIIVDGDASALTVMDETFADAGSSQYGPMQAFTFVSGIGEPNCQEAPRDGILVQSPAGAGMIELLINEVKIEMGSTVFLQAAPDDYMTISVIEGQAIVTALGSAVMATEGAQARVQLGSNGLPASAPELSRYSEADVLSLPVTTLPQVVEVASPMNDADFEALATTIIPGWWYWDEGPAGTTISCPPGAIRRGQPISSLIHGGISPVRISIVDNGIETFLLQPGVTVRYSQEGSTSFNLLIPDLLTSSLTVESQTRMSGTWEDLPCPGVFDITVTYAGQQEPPARP